MKRLASIIVTVLLFSLVAFQTSADAKESWTRVRSEHFTLVGDASEREIRKTAARLEQYRTILARIFNDGQLSHSVPTIVIVFKNDEAFKPFRPLYKGRLTDVAGYFQAGRDLNYIAISAEHKGNRSFSTIFHEFVHLFVDGKLRGLPLSINEGVAEYFSTVKVSDEGRIITLGSVNPQRERILFENKLLPLQALLATDTDSDYYNEGDKRSLFYAQSMALVHYLVHRDRSNGLERLTRFLKLLSNGMTVDDGLRQVFQTNLVETEKALQAYVSNAQFPTRSVPLDQRLTQAKEMQSSKITDSEAQAYIGDLLIHLNRFDEAEMHLQKSLAVNPDLVTAHASLGLLRVRQERTSEAIRILRRAVTMDPHNYLTQYYYAYALSRVSMSEKITAWGYQTPLVDEMRAALGRAIELSPNFIEAHRLQAFLNLSRNENLDKAEASLERALELSSGRQDIMLILAQVHLRRLNFLAARKDLEPILQHSADKILRKRATVLLEEITAAEAQALRPDFIARQIERTAADQAAEALSPFQMQAHAARPRLARRFKGERVLGILTDIKCMEKGVVFSVKIGKLTLRLYAAELRSVFFVAYVPDLERTVTCGSRATQNLVVLTYDPSIEQSDKYDGKAIAIEFVPEDIDLEP